MDSIDEHGIPAEHSIPLRERTTRQPAPQRGRTAGGTGVSNFRLPVLYACCFSLVLLLVVIAVLSAGTPAMSARSVPMVKPANKASVQVPRLSAEASVLMDGQTGQTLYEWNADERLANASTTKICTAIVVLESSKLSDVVTVSANAASTGESGINLIAGEQLTVEQLLNVMLIQSANDAAVALAEHVGGSVEGFAAMMNAKAASLGCTNTHFVNPHGLDDPNHYTTARDLGIMGCYAMRNPVFRKIVTTRNFGIPTPGQAWQRVATSHNKFLDMYAYATGIKTGLTDHAGYCLVGGATKNGRELVSVVLGCSHETFYDDTITLMEYGFNDWTNPRFDASGDPLAVEVGNFPQTAVAVADPGQPDVLMRRDRLVAIEQGQLMLKKWTAYPVHAGDELGSLVMEGNSGNIVLPLKADRDIPQPGFFRQAASFFQALVAP